MSLTRICCLLTLVAGCGHESRSHDSDSAFAQVQERGEKVMGVDQYISRHVFESLPDGGRIVLDWPDAADSNQVATIRRHMREVAADFERGDFSKPFAVHATEVPGTDVMSASRNLMQYRVVDRPAGAEVRITTTDSGAVRAVHRFLEFQRHDHRAAGH
jgi:hypothetical protein